MRLESSGSQFPESISRDSDWVHLGLGLRFCISNKYPGNADGASAGATAAEPLSERLTEVVSAVPFNDEILGSVGFAL